MISIIVVIGKNREIGYKNQLLWDLPEDMKRFREKTLNHKIVMGDKTFESIGKALPGRENIVLSKNKNYKAPGCIVSNSLENIAKKYQGSSEEVFIIGGGQIYKQFLPFANRLYLTIVNENPEADTFFPNYSEFNKIIFKEKGVDNGHEYKYLELKK